MPRVKVELAPEEEAQFTASKEEENPNTKQYFYKEQEKEKLRSDPEFLLTYRKRIEYGMNVGFAIFYKNTEASEMAKKYMTNSMAERLKGDLELTKRLIPTWDVGCR